MDNECPCCASPWQFGQSRGAVAFVGVFNGRYSLSVYNLDGLLRWRVFLDRHTGGSSVTANSCCFGRNQTVYALQREIHTSPTFFSNYYLYKYDRNGTFLSETVLSQYIDLANYGNVLSSNNAGQVAVTQYVQTPRTYGKIIDGASLFSPVMDLTYNHVKVDDQGYVYIADGTLEIHRWDKNGTYIESLPYPPSSGSLLAYDVYRDGTYLWRASSTLSGSTYTNLFRRVAIPGGAVLTSATTITATQLSGICVAPWGTRLDAFGGDCIDANELGGLQVRVTGAVLQTNAPGGSPTTVTLSSPPVTGGARVRGNAVSID